jgi:hypothetical protein
MAKVSTKIKKAEGFDYRTITSVEEACKKLNFDITTIPDLSMLPADLGEKFKAGIFCSIFILAINDGWVPDYSDRSQPRYFPWPFTSSSGFGFSCSGYYYEYSGADVGSRLCTNSSEKALWALEKCKEHYEKWLL